MTVCRGPRWASVALACLCVCLLVLPSAAVEAERKSTKLRTRPTYLSSEVISMLPEEQQQAMFVQTPDEVVLYDEAHKSHSAVPDPKPQLLEVDAEVKTKTKTKAKSHSKAKHHSRAKQLLERAKAKAQQHKSAILRRRALADAEEEAEQRVVHISANPVTPVHETRSAEPQQQRDAVPAADDMSDVSPLDDYVGDDLTPAEAAARAARHSRREFGAGAGVVPPRFRSTGYDAAQNMARAPSAAAAVNVDPVSAAEQEFETQYAPPAFQQQPQPQQLEVQQEGEPDMRFAEQQRQDDRYPSPHGLFEPHMAQEQNNAQAGILSSIAEARLARAAQRKAMDGRASPSDMRFREVSPKGTTASTSGTTSTEVASSFPSPMRSDSREDAGVAAPGLLEEGATVRSLENDPSFETSAANAMNDVPNGAPTPVEFHTSNMDRVAAFRARMDHLRGGRLGREGFRFREMASRGGRDPTIPSPPPMEKAPEVESKEQKDREERNEYGMKIDQYVSPLNL